MTNDFAALVMAAGLGTRMRSATPKHLHPLLGRRVVDWVLFAARAAGAQPLVVVASPDTRDGFDGLDVAVQERPLGTGDAVRAARSQLESASGDLLVLSGDTPLLTPDVLRGLVETHRREGAAATVLSFEPPDPRSYGRLVRDGGGRLARIVEAADATPDELELREVNASIYVFAAGKLWPALERLEPHNAQGELYLTDAIGFLVGDGEAVAIHVASDPVEAEGINTRAELAAAAAALRDRINEAHMLAGVTIVDPQSTWIDAGVEIEPDVTIHPFTVVRGEVRILTGAEIGPFAYIRPGTSIGEGAKIGAFVEVKQTAVGARTKIPHLSYIGDAEIGEDTNIAAGNITANFKHAPGEPKAKTRIGRNVRTGVDNTFDAPVEVGDDAWLAPGAVITDDVPPGSLAGFAPRQITKEGWDYDKRGNRADDDD
jgi:bifunctional UDP-N-acetylglucosamine pyrophosphorylase / glucosamine-1-phosphate N-acetyltransferase